nr:tetratricopeptide repeat protein [Pyrinomonadaceae bacterium]
MSEVFQISNFKFQIQKKSVFICFHLWIIFFLSLSIHAQDLQTKIRAAVENREYQTAINELESLEKSDKKLFELNNYDYLLARMHAKKGDFAKAAMNFQAVVNRNSILKEYALWHLSQIARSSGNLLLERTFLQEILTLYPNSLLTNAAQIRLTQSYFESKNYEFVIRQLSVVRNQSNNEQTRENQLLLAQAYLQSGKTTEAKEIFTRLVSNLAN